MPGLETHTATMEGGFGESAVCLFSGLSEARKHPGHDLDCSLILFFPFSPSWVVTVFVPCDLTLMVMADYTVVDQKIQSLARMIESVFLRKEDTPKLLSDGGESLP